MFVDNMHSFLSRLNTLFAFTLSVLAVLTIGVFVSTYFEQYHGTVNIGVNKPIV
jgi:signal peptidase complex subunit 3